MREINILVTHLKMGGIEIITTNLANALYSRGFHVRIISLLKTNELSNKLNSNIEILYLSNLQLENSLRYKFFWRLYLIKMIHQIKNIHNAIIISTNDLYNMLLSKYGNTDTLKIGQLHHDYWNRQDLIEHFKHRYSRLNVFALLTEDVRTEIEKLIKPFNKITKCITIPNFQPYSTSSECHSGANNGVNIDPYFVAVGRLSPEKGFDRLVKIWNIISKKYSDIPKLLIVGDGPERDKINELIKSYDLSDKISLTGQLSNEETQIFMSKAIGYCMTSYTEGFPLVLLEALSNGIPQIAFDVRVGPRNLIIDSETGYLIKDGDLDSYGEMVMRLCNDKHLREEFARKSLVRAESFSEKRVLNIWEELFRVEGFNE